MLPYTIDYLLLIHCKENYILVKVKTPLSGCFSFVSEPISDGANFRRNQANPLYHSTYFKANSFIRSSASFLDFPYSSLHKFRQRINQVSSFKLKALCTTKTVGRPFCFFNVLHSIFLFMLISSSMTKAVRVWGLPHHAYARQIRIPETD